MPSVGVEGSDDVVKSGEDSQAKDRERGGG
jgi:hypothetical protein